MAHRVTGLQAWQESLSGDDDRPCKVPTPRRDGPAGDIEVVFYSMLESTVFQCAVDTTGLGWRNWKPRTTQDFRRRLEAEARRYERGVGWRGGNPALARGIAKELRRKAANLPKQLPGRPQGYNPARPLVDAVRAGLRNELEARGAPEWAAAILAPGHAPCKGGGRAKPSGLNTVKGIVAVLAERAGIELPPYAIERAIADIRRNERRRRNMGA
jgi:hypothetical protein